MNGRAASAVPVRVPVLRPKSENCALALELDEDNLVLN
jgi:hypothetical protein